MLAGETCCDVITTCETPLCQCGISITNDGVVDTCDENGVHMEFAKLAAVLQESVLHSWKLHLKAKKYSVHMILEEYYKEALEIIDALIEHYQGICKCDIIKDDIEMICVKNDDPIIYFTDLKKYLMIFANDPSKFDEKTFEMKSDIDDLLRLIDSTLYKLSHLTESKIKSFDAFIYENFN